MATDTASGEEIASDGEARRKQVTDLLLCYLACPKDAAGGFLGAILLTDYRARPQHFAYVQAIRPSKLQQLLYGSTLTEYVKVDVIAQKLWQGLPKKPDIVFVNHPDLIPVRGLTRVATAFMTKASESETNSSSLSILRYDIGPHVQDRDYVGSVIVALEGGCDLLEPFARMHQALAEALKPSA